MKVSWLLFDLDHTIVDSDAASKNSFFAACSAHGLKYNEDFYYRYDKINFQVWAEFERGEISAEELRVSRFERFFKQEKIGHCDPADFKQTFVENLVDATNCYPGVPELLKKWNDKYRLSLVTNGFSRIQHPRLKKLDIGKFFESVIISDEIGFAKPDKAYFDYAFTSIENPPSKSETIIVGDSINSDILGGLKAGIKTCWISHGKENKENFQPDYTLNSIQELDGLLDSFNS